MAILWKEMPEVYQKEYYVLKRSGTLADPLLAYGTATVLRTLIENVPGRRAGRLVKVIIEDTGAYYTIQLPEPIREEWLAESQLPHDLARPVLRVPKPKEATNDIPKK